MDAWRIPTERAVTLRLVTVDEAEAMVCAAILFLRIDGCRCWIENDTWVDDAASVVPRVWSEHAPGCPAGGEGEIWIAPDPPYHGALTLRAAAERF